MALRRKKAQTPADDFCYLLVIGPNGRLLKPSRLGQSNTIECDGVSYPLEFCRPIGFDTYELAPRMEMPADGDTRHLGNYADLQVVEQHMWVGSWSTYDRGRKRLNWASITERGDGSGKVFQTVALAIVLIASLLGSWSAWDTSGELGKLNSQVVVLSGQVARYATGQHPVQGGVPNPTEGSLVPPASAAPAQRTQPTPTVKR